MLLIAFQIINMTEWARKAESCDCYAILCPYDTELYPGIVNRILLQHIENFDTEYLMQVKPHFMLASMNPWIVISDFLHCASKTITIPIITPEQCSLKTGDPICHFSLQSLSKAYNNIIQGICYNAYNLSRKILYILFQNLLDGLRLIGDMNLKTICSRSKQWQPRSIIFYEYRA